MGEDATESSTDGGPKTVARTEKKQTPLKARLESTRIRATEEEREARRVHDAHDAHEAKLEEEGVRVSRTLFEEEEKEERGGEHDEDAHEAVSLDVENMLMWLDGDDSGQEDGISEISALERLISRLSMAEAQPDLPSRMGRKGGKPYGTLDGWLKEVEEIYPEEIKSFREKSQKGGRGLREGLKTWVKVLSTGV
jgi:hypothetical protein